jgi:hypothetical protein
MQKKPEAVRNAQWHALCDAAASEVDSIVQKYAPITTSPDDGLMTALYISSAVARAQLFKSIARFKNAKNHK